MSVEFIKFMENRNKQDEEFNERIKDELENYKKELNEEFDKKLDLAIKLGIKDKEEFYMLLSLYNLKEMKIDMFKSEKEIEYLKQIYKE